MTDWRDRERSLQRLEQRDFNAKLAASGVLARLAALEAEIGSLRAAADLPVQGEPTTSVDA